MRRAVILLLVLACAAGLAIAGARYLYERPGPLAAATDIVVPRGSTDDVARALYASGAIENPLSLRAAALATRGDGSIHAAELAFSAHASLREVLAVLRTGRPVEHTITIPEGLTAAEIAELVERDDALAGPVTVPQEGAVLPQTYDYERGTRRNALLARMRAAMTEALARVWRARAPGGGLRSPSEMLVLASMVERETGVSTERPMVAAVFLNRLRLGMKLQSDPTAAYQATGGIGALARPLTRSDLALPGTTNTYVLPGLPAAPICSPGLASLEAAAHPAATDALYFVASGTGGHVFAASLGEHLRNVDRYKEGQGSALDPPGPEAPDPIP
jgi:UPF0755 protein